MTQRYIRIRYQHSIKIHATKEEVFPLLCLVREGEWLPDFSSETVFSESGITELDSIFVTGHKTSYERFWIIPIYKKNNFIEMVYFQPETKIVIIKLTLQESSTSKTSLQVEYIYTSISDKGNAALQEFTEEDFIKQINQWQVSLNYLFEKGSRIPENLLLQHH